MADDQLIEKIRDRQKVFNGRIIHVEHWRVTLPNGKDAMREVALHNGASAIVPVDDKENVYLVRQYRAPLEKVIMEIPAGKLDSPSEDRLDAAKRELREETGFTAANWTHLTDMATTPGFCTEVISLYLARELTKGDTDMDEDEFLGLVKMPLSEAVDMVYAGRLSDSKTIAALLLAERAIRGR